jgi:hypothetical protein
VALLHCINRLAHSSQLGYIRCAETTRHPIERTAAVLFKRPSEANWAMRTLFVFDCIRLAIQTDVAFAKHLPHLSASRREKTRRGCFCQV